MGTGGYGLIGVRANRHEGAHRVSYRLHCGEIPSGKLVRHRCDVRCCVNPAHLELGTPADNTADRDNRGRTAIGVKNAKTKLTADQVREIRASSENNGILGRRFGVTRGAIAHIKKGRNGKYVK